MLALGVNRCKPKVSINSKSKAAERRHVLTLTQVHPSQPLEPPIKTPLTNRPNVCVVAI